MNTNFTNPDLILKQCRICLVSDQEMNLFFEPYFDGTSLAEILKIISTIQVEDNVIMPRSICSNCTKTIINFKQLMKVFQESEVYLKELISKSDDIFAEKEYQNIGEVYNDKSSIESNDDDNHEYKDDYDDYLDQEASLVSDEADTNNTKIPDESLVTSEGANTTASSKSVITNSTTEEIQSLEGNSEYEAVDTIKYSCEICGDCFLFKSGFSHHMLMVHNVCIQVNQYEQYSSTISIKVPKVFPDHEIKSIRRTASIPLRRKDDFQCKKCKENFLTADELKKHSEVHKTFRCDQCGAAFIKNSYLRDHLLKHSTDKCYSCKICGQAFKYRSALAVHRRDHVGNNRGYMCETCGRSFKERGTLKTHIMLKHTNERNFSCTGCGLTFKLKAARDKHFMRKHTNNRTKDFVCSMCGMAYLNKETLTRHITDKHSDVPTTHWCTVCEKSFTMKSNLFKHLRNKHNVITKND